MLIPDWKGFPRANPLAYWALPSVMKEKSFITLTPGQSREPRSRSPKGEFTHAFSTDDI
jgi:hypothetical protein